MEQEKELTSQESLELIAKMINRAKRDYLDTGLSALLWGSVIPFCSLVAFANHWVQRPEIEAVWLLAFVAIIPQVIIATREARARKHKSHEGGLLGGIWIAFGIVMCLFWFILRHPNESTPGIYLAVYGIPTFVSGYARRFRPSIIGAIVCWVLSIVSMFVHYPYSLLCITAGALVAWFIPGLILRRRYLQAKQQHV